MEAPWWQRAFRADYLQLYAHRDVASAREEVGYLAARGWLGGRVLDLCCGQGRHSLALAERGHAVQGLDWSQDLLDRARLLDTAGLLRGRLQQGDARELPYVERSFDTVVQLFTSFGYFDRQGDLTVLTEVARVLDGDGLWILDLINPALLRRTLVPHSVRTHEGIQIEETRALVEEGQAVRKDIRYTDPAGREQQWSEQVRLWTAEELIEPARRAGLTLEARVGGFRGEPWGEDAPRQLLVWRKDAH